jgi:beta-glucosidase
MGISPKLEGEEGDAAFSEAGGDRASIDLPGVQQELIEKIQATGKPVILVLFNGSAVAVNWAQDNVPAILSAWYPGEEGGTALADVLFGDCSPAGRLPVTFVKSLEQLPPFEDYSMEGRTYRYMREEPLYPFGFGLSYTSFEYSDLSVSQEPVSDDRLLKISVEVRNTGDRPGDEVVQAYVSHPKASMRAPLRSLVGFQRVTLAPGESKRVSFTLTLRQLAVIDDHGNAVVEPGSIQIAVGGSQGDERSLALGAAPAVTGGLEVSGERRVLPY